MRRRKFLVTTDSNHGRRVYPNLACTLVLPWVGGQNFSDPNVIVMVVVVAIVGLLMLIPFAKYLAKFSKPATQLPDDSPKLESLEQSATNGARRAR